MERASAAGVPLRGRNTRTEPLTEKQLKALELDSAIREIRINRGRDATFMIFRSKADLGYRGPNQSVHKLEENN